MQIDIRTANENDLHDVSEVLQQAAKWLEAKGQPLWTEQEVAPDKLRPDILSGRYVIARDPQGAPVGAFKLHEDEPEMWPDVPGQESLFLHKMALVRREAGKGLAQALIAWALRETKNRGKRFLRLDFLADRPKLRTVYEQCGFRHHSDRQVAGFNIARYEFELR
ncbi:MAG: GNAT family N-acetyltransferase [Candidatus Methylacidiphilales bacterium]|nr:GNAT family N-acetyltransferase [Candidatus Methylacidiphilales bacterium]